MKLDNGHDVKKINEILIFVKVNNLFINPNKTLMKYTFIQIKIFLIKQILLNINSALCHDGGTLIMPDLFKYRLRSASF